MASIYTWKKFYVHFFFVPQCVESEPDHRICTHTHTQCVHYSLHTHTKIIVHTNYLISIVKSRKREKKDEKRMLMFCQKKHTHTLTMCIGGFWNRTKKIEEKNLVLASAYRVNYLHRGLSRRIIKKNKIKKFRKRKIEIFFWKKIHSSADDETNNQVKSSHSKTRTPWTLCWLTSDSFLLFF